MSEPVITFLRIKDDDDQDTMIPVTVPSQPSSGAARSLEQSGGVTPNQSPPKTGDSMQLQSTQSSPDSSVKPSPKRKPKPLPTVPVDDPSTSSATSNVSSMLDGPQIPAKASDTNLLIPLPNAGPKGARPISMSVAPANFTSYQSQDASTDLSRRRSLGTKPNDLATPNSNNDKPQQQQGGNRQALQNRAEELAQNVIAALNNKKLDGLFARLGGKRKDSGGNHSDASTPASSANQSANDNINASPSASATSLTSQEASPSTHPSSFSVLPKTHSQDSSNVVAVSLVSPALGSGGSSAASKALPTPLTYQLQQQPKNYLHNYQGSSGSQSKTAYPANSPLNPEVYAAAPPTATGDHAAHPMAASLNVPNPQFGSLGRRGRSGSNQGTSDGPLSSAQQELMNPGSSSSPFSIMFAKKPPQQPQVPPKEQPLLPPSQGGFGVVLQHQQQQQQQQQQLLSTHAFLMTGGPTGPGGRSPSPLPPPNNSSASSSTSSISSLPSTDLEVGGYLFDVSLELAVERAGCKGVPYILVACVEQIEKIGLETEGLYRVPGSMRRVKEWAEKFELAARDKVVGGESQQLGYVDMVGEGASTLASLAKKFLGRIKGGWAEDGFWEGLDRVVLDSSEDSVVANMRTFIDSKLPVGSPRRSTVTFFVYHLHRIHLRSAKNMMHARNLVIVIFPTLNGKLGAETLISRAPEVL